MFERRNEPDLDGNPGVQDRLADALRDRGGQVLIYGDTGVGKSSLLKYAAEDESLAPVTVECTTQTDYQGILDTVVQTLLEVKEVKRKQSSGAEAGTSAEGSVPGFAKLRATFKGTTGTETEYEIVEKPAVDVATEVMAKTGKSLIVLDNFQNINSDETRELVAQLLERLSDRASDRERPEIKCVVIGIAEDATSLLGSSRSYLRRTAQIGVPRMPDDEIRALLSRGFKLLGIDVPEQFMNQFVFYSDGFPYFAHLVGLQVARATIRASAVAGVRTVTAEQLQSALNEAARSVDASYRDRIRLAKENGGDTRPRTQIMKMLAESSEREWTSADIQRMWSEKLGRRDDYAFMHAALGQLLTEKHGEILIRTGKKKSYRYRFTDPHIRPYLRIVGIEGN